MDLLVAGEVDHLSLGNHEFDPPTETLAKVLAEAETRGLKTHIANATCDPKVTPLCTYLGEDDGTIPRRYRIFERDDVRIAVVSVLDQLLPKRVTPGRTDGLTFSDPAAAAKEIIYGLRTRGEADVIIVVAHLEHTSTSPRQVLEFTRALVGSERPDLVIANGLHADTGDAGVIEVIRMADGLPPIVGTGPYPTAPGATHLRIDPPATPGGRAVVTVESLGPLDPAGTLPTDLAMRAEFLAEARAYCAEAGEPLGAGRLAGSMDAEAFRSYVLEVMRRGAEAEIAMLNAGVVDTPAFPLKSHITRDDLSRALPYDATLMVARVKGDELLRFLKSRWKWREITDADGLRITGPTTSNLKLFKINGRPLDPDVPYRVVTIDFVATGGDDILEGFSGTKWKWKPLKKGKKPVALRSLMESHLLAKFEAPEADEPHPAIDLSTNFKPLEDRLLWDMRLDLNAGFTDVTIRSTLTDDQNEAAPQLARGQLTSLFADITFELYANSSSHAFDFRAAYLFGWSSTDLFGANKDAEVATDLLAFEAIYRFRLFKKFVGPDKWYVPEPYIAWFLESELIPALDEETGMRLPRQRTGVLTVGYRWRFIPKLELKIGAGAKSTGSGFWGDPPVFVTEIGFRLTRIKLGAPLKIPLYLESEVNVFSGERYEAPKRLETEVRGTATLFIQLGFNLFFAITSNVYALNIYDFRRDIGERSSTGVGSELIGTIRVDLDFRAMHYD